MSKQKHAKDAAINKRARIKQLLTQSCDLTPEDDWELLNTFSPFFLEGGASFVDGICAEIYQSGNEEAIDRLENFADLLMGTALQTPKGRTQYTFTLLGVLYRPSGCNVADIDKSPELEQWVSDVLKIPAGWVSVDRGCISPYLESEEGFSFSRFMDVYAAKALAVGVDLPFRRGNAQSQDWNNHISEPLGLYVTITLPKGKGNKFEAWEAIDILSDHAETIESVIATTFTVDGHKMPSNFTPIGCGLPGSVFSEYNYFLDRMEFQEEVKTAMEQKGGNNNNIAVTLNPVMLDEESGIVEVHITDATNYTTISQYRSRKVRVPGALCSFMRDYLEEILVADEKIPSFHAVQVVSSTLH